MNKSLILLLVTLVFCSCEKEKDPIVDSEINSAPNILLIIADDLGKDALSGFTEGSIKPNTPNIDALRNSGLSFTNLWVNPTCSPTRASIITGKFGYRTGVKGAGDLLSASEVTLQKYISDETNNAYASALIGKWHLSGSNSSAQPESFGIDYYSGLIRGSVQDYYDWKLTEDGSSSTETGYITEVFTDLAIDWVSEQSKPWFLWLAYTAPHTPFHVPPSNMHSQGDLPAYNNGREPLTYFMAAIEAMDYQIGRLLEEIAAEERDNTIIIFVGDNGTPPQVIQSPYTSATAKSTVFQGGVNTPMFISGNGVTRTGVDDNLINGTDLFATIAEIAGSSATEIHDSKSFKSLLTSSNNHRNFQYSEMDDGEDDIWAISNGEHKLMVNANGTEKMYNVRLDPYESMNLLSGTLSSQEASAKAELEAELSSIRK